MCCVLFYKTVVIYAYNFTKPVKLCIKYFAIKWKLKRKERGRLGF